MSLITTTDLLAIEPTVFTDAAAAARAIETVNDGSITSTSLSSASADFVSAGVTIDDVAVADGAVLEITEVVDANTLTVSKPRPDIAGPLVKPSPGTNMAVSILSMTPLIEQSQAWLLGALGIDADDPVAPLDEDDIVNGQELAHVLALKVIAIAFSRAAAHDPATQSLADRASHFAQLARDQLQQTKVYLDLDADGEADATRHISVATLRRS